MNKNGKIGYMFEGYKATTEDLKAIEEGIATACNQKLKFIFKNKDYIKKIIIISYDSENIYIWSQIKFPKLISLKCGLKQYFAYKIPHQLKICDDLQRGWAASLQPRELTKLLFPKLKTDELSNQFISGGLLTPFIALQKKLKDRKNNPYISRESYLATIIHEFGHAYWHQHKLWYYSNKEENLLLLKTANSLYRAEMLKKSSLENKNPTAIPIRFPTIEGITEIFAFCTEYQASKIFWPVHKQNFDKFAANRTEFILQLEKTKNLNQEDSVLEPQKYPHNFAFVFSKILLTLYPETWQQKLLQCSQ